MEENKKTRIFHSFANFLCVILIIQGAACNVLSISYFLQGDTSDKWFSRAALSIICYGFAGIIAKLEK